MKKNYIIICFLLFSKIGLSQVTITPNPFEVNESITITVDINSTSTNCNTINNPSKVYMHSGIGNDSDPWGFNVIGNWGQDDGVGEMTNTSGNNWSITITPETYFNLTSVQVENAIKMGMVFRNSDGTQELKANGCSDFFFEIGTFQISLSSPIQNSTTILNSGDNIAITATNIGGNATYVLKTNGNILNTQSNTSSYSFTHTNITNNQSYELEVTLASTTIVKQFSALINPGSNIGVMPTNYQDGITYLSDTKSGISAIRHRKRFCICSWKF